MKTGMMNRVKLALTRLYSTTYVGLEGESDYTDDLATLHAGCNTVPILPVSAIVAVEPDQVKPLKLALLIQNERPYHWFLKLTQLPCEALNSFKSMVYYFYFIWLTWFAICMETT